MKLTVAILIPCYNSASFLPELIQSIMNQSIQFDEVILYDDASTDSTIQIANEYQVKIIKGEVNMGAAFARNRLLENCTCNYLHYHDSDDLLSPIFLETMLKNIENENTQLLCNSYVLNREDRNIKYGDINYSNLRDGDPLSYFLDNVGFASMGLYSQKALKSIGGFNERLRGNEDPDLHIRLLLNGFSIKVVDEYLVTKLEHQNSYSSNNWFRCLSDKLLCLEEYYLSIDISYHQIIGKQAFQLSNYFYREGDIKLSNKACALGFKTKVKHLDWTPTTSFISKIFGIKSYLWIYRRRVDFGLI